MAIGTSSKRVKAENFSAGAGLRAVVATVLFTWVAQPPKTADSARTREENRILGVMGREKRDESYPRRNPAMESQIGVGASWVTRTHQTANAAQPPANQRSNFRATAQRATRKSPPSSTEKKKTPNIRSKRPP